MPEEQGELHRTLSVIVPIYNERNTVAELVRRMRLVDIPLDLEVVMVDDGSTDGTEKVLAAVEDSTVQVVRHPANLGKGASIRTGLAHARGDLVLVQDADLEYDPRDWPRLLEPVLSGSAQVVYGSRLTGRRVNTTALHWLASRFLALATDALYDTSLSDVLTGYKLFDRKVLDSITIESDRFEFEPEVTAKVLRRGYRIYEVPIAFWQRPRAEGRKFRWRDGMLVLWTLVRLRVRRSG